MALLPERNAPSDGDRTARSDRLASTVSASPMDLGVVVFARTGDRVV